MPELRYLEAKFAGLTSYGLSARLLAEVLPLGRPLQATTVRRHLRRRRSGWRTSWGRSR